jgi:hypothetical protein
MKQQNIGKIKGMPTITGTPLLIVSTVDERAET